MLKTILIRRLSPYLPHAAIGLLVIVGLRVGFAPAEVGGAVILSALGYMAARLALGGRDDDGPPGGGGGRRERRPGDPEPVRIHTRNDRR